MQTLFCGGVQIATWSSTAAIALTAVSNHGVGFSTADNTLSMGNGGMKELERLVLMGNLAVMKTGN